MTELIAPLARIVSRYVSGALLSYGFMADEGDIYVLAAAFIGAVVEVAYAFAKRKGWAT
jgi:hypothetical protein